MRLSAQPLFAMFAIAFWVSGAAGQMSLKSSADILPRKVIVGTVVKGFWGKYPGLPKRLEELTGLVDRLSEESRKKYGRGLDLAVLPETVVNGEVSGDIVTHSIEFEGPVKDAFVRKARECNCRWAATPWKAVSLRAKMCRSSNAISGNSASRSASTWSMTTAGKNWRVKALIWWFGRLSRRVSHTLLSGPCRNTTTSSQARGATTRPSPNRQARSSHKCVLPDRLSSRSLT
jgi:hypothetical protein